MRTLLAALLVASSSAAQSFNIDLGNTVAPSSGYVSAVGIGLSGPWWEEAPLPGVGPWNAVPLGGASQLIATNGLVTGVSLTSTASQSFLSTGTALAGDDHELMLDGELTPAGSTTTYTFTGLAAGSYVVTTYAWNPDNQTSKTRVTMQVSVDPAFNVGNPWNGSPHSFLTTYARQESAVLPGGTIRLTVEGVGGVGVVNGFQIRSTVTGASFCWGDGSGTACPCGNSTLAPRGCANAAFANGAELTTRGIARITHDTLLLDVGGNAGQGFGIAPGSNALFFQGTSTVASGFGAMFGDGLRCVGGSVVRLGITTADTHGRTQYPQAGLHSPVSVRGATSAGVVRHYQVMYRDASASYCTADRFNLTNGMTVIWQP